jgi:hypothetical protein
MEIAKTSLRDLPGVLVILLILACIPMKNAFAWLVSGPDARDKSSAS